MKHDYTIHALPNDKGSVTPSLISTSSRERALAFVGMLWVPDHWKEVWVEHQGKRYSPEQLGDMP